MAAQHRRPARQAQLSLLKGAISYAALRELPRLAQRTTPTEDEGTRRGTVTTL
jgi:hypothetical protein